MTNTSIRLAACALLASTALTSQAFAQAQGTATIYKNLDGNGVDLTAGTLDVSLTAGSLGQGEGGLTLVEKFQGGPATNLPAYFRRTESGTQVTISIRFGDREESFTGAKTATSFSSNQGTGATLTKVSAEQYFLTDAVGAVTTYSWPSGTFYQGGNAAYCAPGRESICALITHSTVMPNGLAVAYTWKTGQNCKPRTLPNGEIVYDCVQYYRLTSLSKSSGYKVTLAYLNNTNPTTGLPNSNWYKRTGATFHNGATQIGTSTLAFPSSTITDFTDIGGRTWRITKDTDLRVTGIRRPGSASDNVTIGYAAGTASVSQVVADGVTTNYAYVDSGTTRTTTVTNALSQQSVVTSDMTIGRPTSFRDALNRTTSVIYDANGRPTRTTQPEGNYVQLTYDTRGNVTQSKAVAKAGSGLADIIGGASFDAACANIVICNKPNTTTDERGNVTDYTYDATHGGPLTVTTPAPSTGAIRPQVRYSYSAVTSATGQPVTMLAGVSACQTLASCTGSSDETKASVAYNGNLLSTSVSRGDGSGTLTATTAMTYDLTGNMLTVDGPLAGTDDTTRFRYDTARQRIGTIAPDPDGAGTLKHRAVRITYRLDGQVSKQELGTVNSQSDPDWANFAPLETVDIGFDTNNRPITQKLSGGGTAYALTQTSYDAIGRPDCTATRMNSAIYGSLPASACTLGTAGSFGPDRIAKTIYDAAGQVTQSQVAVGTTDAANERTLTYTSNGKLFALTDAENNKTSYEYDGHDRLSKTRMPLPTQGSNASSTSDYEQLGYDAASNVTSRRLRDATSIAFTYDNLDRVTLKDLPGSEPDVTYVYDNLNRLTSASQTGHALTFTYDALSRNLTQVGPQGTVASQWDLAGRRTRLTYPGSGLYVDYDYLVTGETVKLRENGATSGVGVLATLAYDDLGRRTSLTRGNGTVTSYGYDPVSRLATLAEDMAGTTNDQSSTFSYNPASQIGGVTRTNDAYAWTGHGNGSTASIANGLNQLTSIGAAATSHDARGNVTSDPTSGKAYGYSSENLLTSASGGVALAYDPAMRLYQLTGTATTRLGYDGLAMIAEYDGANAIAKRYVHGPGVDEPLVEYDGSGTAAKRWLHADERGSVIAQSDSSGNVTTINRYDEYGKPQATNVGRFQYTGQTWLPEVGAYYYKARFYSPGYGGRFLQTDRIGYAGGINIYAYVGNDPVNRGDPSGTSYWPSRLAIKIGKDGGREWGSSSGGSSGGGFFDSSGNLLGDAVDNTFWEPVDGGTGQWGGDIVSSGGAFFSLPSASSQATNRTCYENSNCNIEQAGTRATVLSIITDPDVRNAMKYAFRISVTGHDSKPYRHEHGFWIYKRGSDYFAGGLQESSPGQPNSIYSGPGFGSNIWFHTHPFGNPFFGGPSYDDYQNARIRQRLSLILSWDELYWLDRR